MASLDGRKPNTVIKAISSGEDTISLISSRLSSLNFDGFIPRENIVVQAPDLVVGETIFDTDPSSGDNSIFITNIRTENIVVNDVEELTYFLYYLGENDLEEPYVYGAENENGSFSENHIFYVLKDDLSTISLGNNGWMLTNQGNAVFSNVFVRGAIEATSGKIDGILTVGDTNKGNPLVTIGKDIFGTASFEGITSEHNGIFLNKNNYLLGYEISSSIPISSIVVTNSTQESILRKATFTLAGHTLSLNDKVYISGFEDDKFLELDSVLQVREITNDTFTVYYQKEILSPGTNPITVSLLADSYALDEIKQITQLSLTNVVTNENVSTANVYFENIYTTNFFQGGELELSAITNAALPINGPYIISSLTVVSGSDYDYATITVPRVVAGTYTTGVGEIVRYDPNYKFKVGDNDNSMSYNSYTGALTVTGRINANSGNFTNILRVGDPSLRYSISNKQLIDNVATLTTSSIHSLTVGDVVVVSGVDATFNGTYTISSVQTGESFSYSKTATNVVSTPVSPVGSVEKGEESDGTIFVGYGANEITITGTSDSQTSAIFAGAGNYGETDTGFFMDASGRFSLKDKLTFTDTGNLTVTGTINASAGNFTGFVTAGNMKIGKDVESTNDGVYINSTNYWYDDGKFSLGSGTKKIYFDGTDVKITSDVIIEGGLTTTSLTVGTSPNQMIMSPTAIPGGSGSPGLYMSKTGDFINATTGDFSLGDGGISWDTASSKLTVNGILSGYVTTDIVAVAASDRMAIGYFNAVSGGAPSGVGLKLDENNYWFVGDKFKLGNSTKNVTWSGTDLSVTGTINATAGYIGGTTSGWLIQSDLLSNSSVGFYAPSVRTGTFQADNTPRVAGFSTTSGTSTIVPRVGMAIINDSLLSGGTYIISVTGTSPTYTLTLSKPFLFTNLGQTFTLSEYAIYAGNETRQLSPFKIDYLGNLTATNADISGRVTATSGSFSGTINATQGFIGSSAYGGWQIGSKAVSSTDAYGYLIGGVYKNVGLTTSNKSVGLRKNIIQNPSLEISSAGYVAYGAGTTIARVNTDAYSGSYSLEITKSGSIGSGVAMYQKSGNRYPINPPVVVFATAGTSPIDEGWVEVTDSTGIEIGMKVTGELYVESGTLVSGVSGNRVALTKNVTSSFTQNLTFTKEYTFAVFVKVPSGGENTRMVLSVDYYDSLGNLVLQGSNNGATTITNANGWIRLIHSVTAASNRASFVPRIVTSSGDLSTAGKKILVDGLVVESVFNYYSPTYFDGDTRYEGFAPARWLGEPGLSESEISEIAFFAGSNLNTRSSAPFFVGHDGYLKASNADITGKITATSGTFAGSLSAATGTFAGSLSAATGSFTGEIKATSGYIGGTASGWNITSSLLSNGTVGLFAPISAFTTGIGTVSSKTNAVTAVSSPQTAIAMTNYIGDGTTTATGTSATNHGLVAGDDIFISGAVGAEQVKLNGNRRILSVPTPTTFTFTAQASVASGTYTTGIGTTTTVKTAVYTATGHSFIPGDIVVISGSNAAAYNGTFTVTAAATNTFTVANKATALAGFTSGLAVSVNSAILTTTGFVPATNMSITGTNIAPGAYITAVSGSGPYTLTLSKLSIGTLSGTAAVSSYAIYAGSEEKQLAPFKVDYFGNLTATDANITGAITATSGNIGGFNIPSNDPYRLESTLTQLDTGIKKLTLDSTLDSIGVFNRINVVETSYQTRPSSSDGSYAIYSTGLGYTLSYPVTITSVAISGNAPRKTIIYTVNPNPEQISAGDSVTISGLSADVAPLNTMDVVVSSTTSTTITVTNYNTSIANGTYGLQSGTIGPLSTPYLIADSTAYTDTGNIENYVFTSVTSDVGLEYGSSAGPNIVLGKTRLGDVGLSAVSAIDGSPDVMYIQPGGGGTELGGPLYVGNRTSGTAADLTAGVVINNTGWVWAHRNGTASNSSIFATSGYVAGAWRGIQFLRSLTANATMSNTGYISVPLSTTVAPSFAAGSDYRLKENIRTADDDFINKISSLRLVRFDEIAVKENTNQLGFIAHEVQEIIPEAIEGEKDAINENGDPDYQHIMQVRMLPYLVGALQESIKKIEDLENRLAALES